MKVFKFGGASVNSIERIEKVANILASFQDEKIVVVISAMGKTTNALEKVVEAFFSGQKDLAIQLFKTIRDHHLQTAKYLLVSNYNITEKLLSDFFTEIEWLLYDKPVRNYDYYYDQVVCVGELLSTVIVSAYLTERSMKNNWIDVRDIIRTDDNFRDATIDLSYTQQKVDQIFNDQFASSDYIVTQGFIGSTDENESTTLGREGSDYTSAIFANMLNAESLSIWKDVEGVMNADPKEFQDARYIPVLSYEEAIEMAYYGAQVIHPKTIKPLQNKKIPLFVKCFLDKDLPGTVIHMKQPIDLPPIIVVKKLQVLIHLRTTDFSFVGEKPLANLYHLFEELKIKPNLMQTGAVTIQVCMDEHPDKIEKLALEASRDFEVQLEKNLTLITIRHGNEQLLNELISGRKLELLQRSQQTTQAVIK